MKKTLVALAALAATSAFAQSVTLYGLVDVGYGAKQFEKADGTVVGKQSGVMDGGFAGNRIGFRGTEDLGNGQAIGFVIEQGISPTNGALFGVRTATAGLQYDGYAASTGKFDQGTTGGYSQGTNRQAFASFADKSLGEVRVGYQYTALYEMSTLMGFTTLSEGVVGGSASHTHGQAAAGGTRANGINYISPRYNNFGLSIQTGSAAGRDTTEFNAAATNTAAGTMQEKNKRSSLKLDFEQGPWKAAVAQTNFNYAKGDTGANAKVSGVATVNGASTWLNTFNVYGALTSVGAGATDSIAYNTKLTQIAGSYTASNWKVGYQRTNGTYNISDEGAPLNGGTATSYGAFSKLGSYDVKAQRISGQYSIGSLDLIAGQGTASVSSVDGVKQMDLKETQVGALYNLSKRSRVYFYQGQWTDSGAAATTYYKGKQSIVGMAHSF